MKYRILIVILWFNKGFYGSCPMAHSILWHLSSKDLLRSKGRCTITHFAILEPTWILRSLRKPCFWPVNGSVSLVVNDIYIYTYKHSENCCCVASCLVLLYKRSILFLLSCTISFPFLVLWIHPHIVFHVWCETTPFINTHIHTHTHTYTHIHTHIYIYTYIYTYIYIHTYIYIYINISCFLASNLQFSTSVVANHPFLCFGTIRVSRTSPILFVWF